MQQTEAVQAQEDAESLGQTEKTRTKCKGRKGNYGRFYRSNENQKLCNTRTSRDSNECKVKKKQKDMKKSSQANVRKYLARKGCVKMKKKLCYQK